MIVSPPLDRSNKEVLSSSITGRLGEQNKECIESKKTKKYRPIITPEKLISSDATLAKTKLISQEETVIRAVRSTL